MAEPRPRVFVVDDDPGVRKSLSWLLGSENLDVATYASADTFLKGLDGTIAACALIDVRMPGMSGLALLEELAARGIHLPVIIITGHGDVAMAVDAMKRGAMDFVEKPFDDTLIIRKIRQALDHDEEARNRESNISEFAALLRALTPREREVLALVVEGRVSREISARLGISQKTVAAHRANIMSKTKTDNVPQLVRMVTLAQDSGGAPD